MLTSISVYNAVGSREIDLPVKLSSAASPYIVKRIEGLDPVQASVTTAPYASQDGVLLQNARTGPRNLVMTIGYRPDYLSSQSVESLRRDLYAYFPPKGEVRLRLRNDTYPIVDINGIVEDHSTSPFNQEPEVQISILCTDPYFRAITSVSLNGFNNLPVLPSYYGTAGVGFLFELFVNRSISAVTLENDLNEDLSYSGSLVAGDIFSVSTVRGNKFIRRNRAGTTTSVLDGLVRGYLSMVLDSRTSSFTAKVAGANDMPFRLTFTPRYVGV